MATVERAMATVMAMAKAAVTVIKISLSKT
jgi:hypothetical protein